jgi:hypothetical protein
LLSHAASLCRYALVDYYHSCTNGRRGDGAGDDNTPNPNPGITSELIVNVDNPDEAAAWLEQQKEKGDFVTLLFSPNVHEIRGYNRGAVGAVQVVNAVGPSRVKAPWFLSTLDTSNVM